MLVSTIAVTSSTPAYAFYLCKYDASGRECQMGKTNYENTHESIKHYNYEPRLGTNNVKIGEYIY